MIFLKIWKYIGRGFAVLGVTLAILIGALYGAMWIMVNGPSSHVGRLFVLSVRETSAAGFLADWFMSEEEIAALYEGQKSDEDIAIDKGLIQIARPDAPSIDDIEFGEQVSGELDTGEVGGPENEPEEKDVEVVDVVGKLYNGKMIIVKDPGRVFVGTPDTYGASAKGLPVITMVKKYDALAGINAGGFYDPNGSGTGGIPDGIVISGGKLLWGDINGGSNIAGIDKDHILHVGYMTTRRALDIGIMEAVSFGPALIINGEPRNATAPLGGGLNPRTAIGQRSDGAMLLLVVNGRSAESLGATYDDLIEIMMKFGAVNATNLDGGSSSLMIYEGDYITHSAYAFGDRVVATSFLVRRK